MQVRDFGFICGEFTVSMGANEVIMPGSKNQPMKKSTIPSNTLNETVGSYQMKALSENGILCDIPVDVKWIGTAADRDPLLGLTSKEPALIETLKKHQGKKLVLNFKLRQEEPA